MFWVKSRYAFRFNFFLNSFAQYDVTTLVFLWYTLLFRPAFSSPVHNILTTLPSSLLQTLKKTGGYNVQNIMGITTNISMLVRTARHITMKIPHLKLQQKLLSIKTWQILMKLEWVRFYRYEEGAEKFSTKHTS